MICLDLKSYFADGSKVSDATLMEVLLMNDFKLVINNTTYSVSTPVKGKSHALIALTVWLNLVKGMSQTIGTSLEKKKFSLVLYHWMVLLSWV